MRWLLPWMRAAVAVLVAGNVLATIAHSQQSMQGHFVAQWLTFATVKVNSICRFFNAHIFSEVDWWQIEDEDGLKSTAMSTSPPLVPLSSYTCEWLSPSKDTPDDHWTIFSPYRKIFKNQSIVNLFRIRSSDPARLRKMVGAGCLLDGVRYTNGESFQPNCRYNCTCMDGTVGCTPLCLSPRPPRLWCRQPRHVRVPGQCCKQWVCDDDSRRPRQTALLDTRAFAASGPVEPWHGNCIAYTSPWSPCSTTCGLGISTRISNVNARCWPEQESRLCNLRPCDVDIHPHIKWLWNKIAQRHSLKIEVDQLFGNENVFNRSKSQRVCKLKKEISPK
ncbi:hypothetical protein STEG23_008588 [Scotinomys teguina]